jgi:hypothetical protein
MAGKQNEGKLMTVHTWNGEKQKDFLNFVVEGGKHTTATMTAADVTQSSLLFGCDRTVFAIKIKKSILVNIIIKL